MVDLLIHYSVTSSSSKKYIFSPNLVGAGGIAPLHLAACAAGSDDIIDALTNDPQEIGLHSWDSLLDASGRSPCAYAMMRNNHSSFTFIYSLISLNLHALVSMQALFRHQSLKPKKSVNHP